jgi:CAAX protease family protein
MDQPQPSPAPAKGMSFIFLNSRGLRAGWRLLIFAGMVALLVSLSNLLPRSSGSTGGQQPAGYTFPIILVLSEVVAFLLLLFLSWIMSKIERRSMGIYGLPLQKPAVSLFLTGYVFWGFLPLSIMLLVMRAAHVFYFENLGLHGRQILIWGALWGFAFLMVGLFEEFVFRGYVLSTLAEGIGFWPAAIIMAVVFARAHMGNSGETRIGIVGVAAFALFASATLWRTGNLWLAVGAHTGWDWGQTFFYGVSDSGLPSTGHLINSHSAGPDWLSGGKTGPEGSVFCLILLVLMTVLFLALHRRPPAAKLALVNHPDSEATNV